MKSVFAKNSSDPCLGNILLFMPSNWIYMSAITRQFAEDGYSIYAFDDRPSTSSLVKALNKINRHLIAPLTGRYISNIIASLKGIVFDYVIVIDGLSFLPDHIKKMRKAFPSAHFIFHVWDSISNYSDTLRLLPFFDKCSSFDDVDVTKYPRFRFLPDFFIDSFAEGATKSKAVYDYCYIGTAHPKKLADISRFQMSLSENGFKGYIYEFLQSRLYFRFCKLTSKAFKGKKANDFHYRPLSYSAVAEIYQESSMVLDSQADNQNGLTMRVFECLATRKKLITANANVAKYDFYCPENIYISTSGSLDFQNVFFTSPYKEVPDKIKYKYSLKSWCKQLIDVRGNGLDYFIE